MRDYCDEHKMLTSSLEKLEQSHKELSGKIDALSGSVSSLPWKISGAIGGLIIIAESIFKFTR